MSNALCLPVSLTPLVVAMFVSRFVCVCTMLPLVMGHVLNEEVCTLIHFPQLLIDHLHHHKYEDESASGDIHKKASVNLEIISRRLPG